MAAGLAAGDPGVRLNVSTGAAVIDIPRVDDKRRQLRLGNIDIPVQVEAECQAGANAKTISISVADTSAAHRFGEAMGPVTIDTLIRLPDRQIAPLVIERFCTLDEGAQDAPQLLVPDVFTVHVSLHCAGENHQSMHYAVAPVGIRLVCEGGTNATSDFSDLTSLPW